MVERNMVRKFHHAIRQAEVHRSGVLISGEEAQLDSPVLDRRSRPARRLSHPKSMSQAMNHIRFVLFLLESIFFPSNLVAKRSMSFKIGEWGAINRSGGPRLTESIMPCRSVVIVFSSSILSMCFKCAASKPSSFESNRLMTIFGGWLRMPSRKASNMS